MDQEVLVGRAPTVVPFTSPGIKGFDETVIQITELGLGMGIEARFGTGFCLDFACRFIGTNYHVANLGRLRAIEGDKVIHRYLATGPDDEGATVNLSPGESIGPVRVGRRSMKYTLERDLAVLELKHPLQHRHGVAFSLRDLQVGQEIDIYAYPKDSINPVRKLQQFHGTFIGQTTTGLLAFSYGLSGSKSILPGASGGIVVDKNSQQIVGILNGVVVDVEAIALAVPVQSLAEFVIRVRPYLGQGIFPSSQGISPVSADLYPKYAPSPTNALEYRTEEPPGVNVLRNKAQALADNMRNFIAVQTFAWGEGHDEPVAEAAYEVRVLDGNQRFRSYPEGKKELVDVPYPDLNRVMVPGGEWSELPEMVGTELHLKIRQASDVVVNERRMKVFQYWAAVEDGVCRWTDVTDLLFLTINKDFSVDCYGEVWTDEDTNILRISEHYELPGKWKDFQGVVTYGWLQRAGEPWLIPLTVSTQAEFHRKVYWCRGQFMDYRMFGARARIVENRSAMSPPRLSQPVE